jgi:RNA polymerase sigma factor (TIGR02999 family)
MANDPSLEARRQHLTEVLRDWSEGNPNVAAEAVPLVYDELRRLAAGLLRRERPGHTLQATALVNEVYLQLSEETGIRFENRAHFLGRIAHMMRRLLVDHARERNADKRGGGWRRITLGDAEPGRGRPPDLVALEDALLSLGRKDPQMVRLVELRYFGGLTLEETADVLGMSRASVVLAWRRTKVWLHRELGVSTQG